MSPKSDVSLRTAVKEHILTGHPITEIECLVLFGVPNLFSVISDIRKNGYIVTTERVAFARALRRLNEHAVVEPPANLPVAEITVTEYRLSR